jgi:putative hemolysin
MLSDILPSLLAMAFCVLMSAYFSATETAFSSLNKIRIKVMAENGDRRAQLTYSLAEDYDRLISTILIGNNIVNIAVASIGTLLFVKIYGDIGATISSVVVTVVVLIFGEITPKSVAKDFPEKFAMFSAPAIRLLICILTPVNFIFTQWKKLISNLLNTETDRKMSQEELMLLLEEAQRDGSIDKDEGDLLKNAVEFRDLEAQDILTPRVDLQAVSIDATKEEIAAAFTESHFSRLLVYDGDIDKISGIVHQKDFYTGNGITSKNLREIISPPIFVRPMEKINDLLKILQANKSHMAVVIDEYGGTLGVVSMEDILEELVGEIWDEHDVLEEPFVQLAPDTYLVEGDVTFDDFCTYFHIKDESESISLGGWIMERTGKVPEKGDSFDYEDLTIQVEQVHNNRIEKVRVIVTSRACE